MEKPLKPEIGQAGVLEICAEVVFAIFVVLMQLARGGKSCIGAKICVLLSIPMF